VALGEWERGEDVVTKVGWVIEDIGSVVMGLVDGSKQVDVEGVAAANLIYTAVRDILGFMEPALKILKDIAEAPDMPTGSEAKQFGIDLGVIMQYLVRGLQWAEQHVTLEIEPTAHLLWEAVDRATKWISSAVTTIGAMTEVEHMPTASTAKQFGIDLGSVLLYLVRGLQWAEGYVRVELQQTTIDLYEAVQKVTATLESAIAAIGAVAESPNMPKKQVMEARAQGIGETVLMIARGLGNAATIVSVNLTEEAVKLLERVQGALGIVQPAIDAIGAIAAYVSGSKLKEKAESLEADLGGSFPSSRDWPRTGPVASRRM